MFQSLKSNALRYLQPPLHAPDVDLPHVFLGSAYGGWPLLETTPHGALVYSFGIGEDISFDLGAIAHFKCEVHGFDPTPKSKAWIETQTLPDSFKFHSTGIGKCDGEATFFAPANERHVSFSAMPASSSVKVRSITAPVMRLQTIMESLRTRPPDVLKMDIEGFEYEVVADILAGSIRPNQLLIEFHHGVYGMPQSKTRSAVQALRDEGYVLYYVSAVGREYGFVRTRSA